MKQAESRYNNKPILMLIATDGRPSTHDGNDDLENFKSYLKHRNADKIFISILACSDNEDDIDYLNKLDVKIKNLDDYKSEKKEVIQKQGANYKYTFGDHIARLALGPVFDKYDKQDEIQLKVNRSGQGYVSAHGNGQDPSSKSVGCCTIC
jgi:hypothetical protein